MVNSARRTNSSKAHAPASVKGALLLILQAPGVSVSQEAGQPALGGTTRSLKGGEAPIKEKYTSLSAAIK